MRINAATQAGDSGEWTAKLDTTLAPNGEQLLTVLTDNKRVNLSVTVKLENELRVFFADLHAHTSYSDGTLLPSVAHDYARNVAKLDVFCLTDHLEAVDDEEWLDFGQHRCGSQLASHSQHGCLASVGPIRPPMEDPFFV